MVKSPTSFNFKNQNQHMMYCRGICTTRYKISVVKSTCHYMNGQKRCGICEVYFMWDGCKCPCCNSVLHVRPRHSKDKIRYYEREGIRWL